MKNKPFIAIVLFLLVVFTFLGILLLPALVSNDADLSIGDAVEQPVVSEESEKTSLPAADRNADPSSDKEDESATSTDSPSADMLSASTEATESTLMFPALAAHPERVTLREGFFREPLSEEIEEAITGVSFHENDTITYEDLNYLQVLFVDYDGNTQTGELICNKKIADDLLNIFSDLYDAGYQIQSIKLIDAYDGDDDASCADDNTSCFNFRVVEGTTHLSNHAKGLAIDINPFYNPYVTHPDGGTKISPPGSEPYADRSTIGPHMIDENDLCYRLFKEHGFTWGGHWKSLKDYQHFEKPDA